MFWRLLAAFGLLLGATLLLVGAVTVQRAGRYELERLERDLLARAQLVRESLRGVPADRLVAVIDGLANAQGGEPRITLMDEEGKVLADSAREAELLEPHGNRPEIVAAREQPFGRHLRHSRSVDRDLLYVAIRAELPESTVAFVRVAMGPGSVSGFVTDLWGVYVGLAVAGIVCSIVVLALLTRRVTKPLAEVTEAAERIAGGAVGQKVFPGVGGEVARLAGSFNRMSERLAAQLTSLEEDHAQLRAILDGMIEGVIALDSQQRILFANDRAARLLDFHDAVNRRLWDVIRHRTILDLVQRCLMSDQPQREELVLHGRDPRSLLVHAARIAGAPPQGAVLVLHDTSELRRLERLRQEFVANVSHELKTPLTVIKACVETLLDDESQPESAPTRTFLRQIDEQSERLHRLILDLLSLARIEAGGETIVPDAVLLAEAVERCVERHRPRAETKRQALEALPSPPDATAWADEEALAEILDNLVDNAVKYTPEGGTIQLRWWLEDGWANLEVADSGIGIPAEDLPRIFERFYRVDKARSREMGGTGLGLSIVKHQAQAMGGTVVATSAVGSGTRFVVRLPHQRKA